MKIKKAIEDLIGKFGYKIIRKNALINDDRYLDKEEFRYVLWIERLYSKILDVPGQIVELGVFRGRNSIIFGNLIKMNGEEYLRKYIGFDTFEGYPHEVSDGFILHDFDGRCKSTSLDFVRERLNMLNLGKVCSLIKGDASKTIPEYLNEKPGTKIAFLYIDCNDYDVALKAMEAFRDFMSPRGIIAIDQKQQMGEMSALLEFTKRNNLVFKKDNSPFSAPAYTVFESK